MSGRHAAAAAGLLLLGWLGGCALVDAPGGDVAAVVEPTLPACAGATERAQLPAELDGVFPLPPGTVISSAKLAGQGPLVVGGYVPMELKDAAAYLQEELPKAGFTAGEGDAEPDEAEQSFSGKGLEGQWKVHSLLDCPDAVTLTIAVSKTGQ